MGTKHSITHPNNVQLYWSELAACTLVFHRMCPQTLTQRTWLECSTQSWANTRCYPVQPPVLARGVVTWSGGAGIFYVLLTLKIIGKFL